MNKKMIRFIALLAVMCLTLLSVGCKNKNKQEETTVPMETTAATVTTAATEETMSEELKKALEEGWISEDWPEETTEVTEETKPKETDPTKPTDPKATDPTKPTDPKATDPTKPTETEPVVTEPKPTEPKPTIGKTEYEKYLEMSPAQQQAFYESFGSVDAFFEWLNAAKSEYESKLGAQEIEGGSVDLGDIVG